MTSEPRSLGRRALWAVIKTHPRPGTCAWCIDWELRWSKVEFTINDTTPA